MRKGYYLLKRRLLLRLDLVIEGFAHFGELLLHPALRISLISAVFSSYVNVQSLIK